MTDYHIDRTAVAIGAAGVSVAAFLTTIRYGWPVSGSDVAFIVGSPIIVVGVAWLLIRESERSDE